MSFNYEKFQNSQLKSAGFTPDELTDDQKNVVLEPTEAPENYACDGEITAKQAFSYWVARLRKIGLTTDQINKAIRYNFGP